MFKKVSGIFVTISMLCGLAVMPVNAEGESIETVEYSLQHSIELNSTKDDTTYPCHDNRTELGIRIDDSIGSTSSEYVGLIFDKISHPEAITSVSLKYQPATTQSNTNSNRTIEFGKYYFSNDLPAIPSYWCNVNNKSATHYCNKDLTSEAYLNWYNEFSTKGNEIEIQVNALANSYTDVEESDSVSNDTRTIFKNVDADGMIEFEISDLFAGQTQEAAFVLVTVANDNANINNVLTNTKLTVTYDTLKYEYETDRLLKQVTADGASAEGLCTYFEGVKSLSDFEDYNVSAYNGLSAPKHVWTLVLQSNPEDTDELMTAFNSAIEELTVTKEIVTLKDAFISGTTYTFNSAAPTMGNNKLFISQFDIDKIENAPVISARYSIAYSLCEYLSEAKTNNANGTIAVGTVSTLKELASDGAAEDYIDIESKSVIKSDISCPITTTGTDVTTNSSISLKNISEISCDFTEAVTEAKTNGDSHIGIYAETSTYIKLYGAEAYLSEYTDKNGTKVLPNTLAITYDRTARADEALEAVNTAGSAQAVWDALDEYEIEIGIDAALLNALEDSDITAVCEAVAVADYSVLNDIKSAFESAVSDKLEAKIKFRVDGINTDMAGTNNNVPVVRSADITKLKNYDGNLKVVAGMYDEEGSFLKLIEASGVSELNKLRAGEVGDVVTVTFGTSSSTPSYSIATGCTLIKVFVLSDYETLRPLADSGRFDYQQ